MCNSYANVPSTHTELTHMNMMKLACILESWFEVVCYNVGSILDAINQYKTVYIWHDYVGCPSVLEFLSMRDILMEKPQNLAEKIILTPMCARLGVNH